MTKRISSALLLFSLFTIWIISCTKPKDEVQISTHEKSESHNNGQICANCHYQEGPGEGWYSIAGSVIGNYQDHTVQVYDAETQDLLAQVEIDQLGNLYTTESVDFKNGISVVIVNSSGQVKNVMSTIVNTGQCNLCHDGTFEDVIEIL